MWSRSVLLVLGVLLTPTDIQAGNLHAVVAVGPWGFAENPDMDGLGAELAVQHRNGALVIGGRLLAVGEVKIDLLGDDPDPRDRALDLGPSIGVVLGTGALQIDSNVSAALVYGRKTDSFVTGGLGLSTGLAMRLHRGPSADTSLGIRFVANVNSEHSFAGVLLAFVVDGR
jgi:hypothetical protein